MTRSISILVAKVKEARVQTIIEKLTVMTSAKDDGLRDVASLGGSSEWNCSTMKVSKYSPFYHCLLRSQDGRQRNPTRVKISYYSV
jgi:hypothetical protein